MASTKSVIFLGCANSSTQPLAQLTEEIFSPFLDIQLAFLLKEEEASESIPFLNLSPFLIDKNAFVDDSDVSKIYFFHHSQSHPKVWAYRWVQRPGTRALLVPGEEYEIVEEQMEAFMQYFT